MTSHTIINTAKLDRDAADKFEEKFLAILDRLEKELGFRYRYVDTSCSGPAVYSAWAFRAHGDDVLYDKLTKTVELVK